MSFMSRAELFLTNQGSLSGDPNVDIMIDTVKYLLDNAIGYQNRKSTKVIYRELKIKYKRMKNKEYWQNNVLNKLRDVGIFIGSKIGGGGGIFLIETKEDAEIVQGSYKHRIGKEQSHLDELERQMKEANWLQ
jgi:hypothetical protein